MLKNCICFVALVQLFLLLTIEPSNGTKFTTVNKCSYTVWPGIQGRSKSNPNWQLPFGGGWKLGPGQSVSFDVPNDLYAARIWGRTNCNTNSQFRCDTGI